MSNNIDPKMEEIREEWLRVEGEYLQNPETRDPLDQAHPWIGYLLSEYDRLDMELKIAREYTDELKRQIDHDDMNLKGMSDTIERMKEALEWYGERDNYIPTIEKPTGTMFSEVEQDCGEKARAILSHLKG